MLFPGTARQGRCATKRSPTVLGLLQAEKHRPRNDMLTLEDKK
ncbi:MAG: hypothetical protein Q8K73_02360 [Anaerolineales bacterium]|nr:hypothetical protein [Anaerolineales bacterium]